LEVCIKEHKHNLKQGLLEKSKLTQHIYEEGHHIKWDEAKSVQKEPNAICRKYKESAHMAYLESTISQPSLEMSPIWLPIIKEEIKRIHENGSLSQIHGEVHQLQFSSQRCFVVTNFQPPPTLFLILFILYYLQYF
jgi:hypothetical protein